MKKSLWLSVVMAVIMLITSQISVFAVGASDIDAAVYAMNGISLSGSPLINGDAVVTGGSIRGTYAGNRVTGTLYYTPDAEFVYNNFNAAEYTGEVTDYAFDDYRDAPVADEFASCEFADGTDDLVIDYWADRAEERSNGYTLTENAYLNKLEVKPNLTLNISAEQGTLRVIHAKELTANGTINVVGDGDVILFVEKINQGRNGFINAGESAFGDSDSLTVVFLESINLSIFRKIAANIVAMGDVTVTNVTMQGNIYANGNVSFSNNGTVTGFVYAPNSATTMNGSTAIEGKLITNSLDMSGNCRITLGETTAMKNSVKTFITRTPEPVIVDPVIPPVLDDGTVQVVRYDVEADTYVCGTMSIRLHRPNVQNFVYSVLDETTFTETSGVVTEEQKAELNLIADTTNSVFQFRKSSISLTPFGRVDSEAYQYALTIAPYVVPLLTQAGFSSFDTVAKWLVWGDRDGTVEYVWLQIGE